jgi:four helix bundle protein
MKAATHFRELLVYQGALALVMEVFRLTKHFPADERYMLGDQIRRSSRSVCANLAEGWRKRRYPAAFISKLSDAEAEAAETQVHLEIAHLQGYMDNDQFAGLDDAYDKVLAQIVKMIEQAPRWALKTPDGSS